MQKELKNERLELAISLLMSDKKKENLEKVMEEMKTALLYVPSTISDEMKAQMMQLQKAGAPTPQTKIAISPIFLRNQNGVNYLPIYTSKAHVPKEQKYPVMFALPFAECNHIALQAKDKISGIVINPFTDNLVLNVTAVPKHAPQNVPPQQRPASPEQKQMLLRKSVELGMIPQRLFKEKGKFVEELSAQKEEGLAKMFAAVYGANGATPYAPADFNMIVMDISDSLRLVDMEMPEQFCGEGCAKSIYIGWNPKTDAVKYYVIVKGNPQKKDTLVELLDGGKVNHLGDAPESGGEVFHMLKLCEDL